MAIEEYDSLTVNTVADLSLVAATRPKKGALNFHGLGRFFEFLCEAHF